MKSPATNVVRLIGILIIFLMLADTGFAQRKKRSGRWKLYRKEVNGGFGVNTFLSGLGEHNLGPIRGASVRPTFNVSFRYWLKERIVLRASMTYGLMLKNDKDEDEEDDAIRRSLRIDYRARFTEWAIMGEYHFFKEPMGRTKTDKFFGRKAGLYGLLGIGLTSYSIAGEYFGNDVEFRSIEFDDDGNRLPDEELASTSITVPFGLGIRFHTDRQVRIGFELTYRLAFATYINEINSVYYQERRTNSGPTGEPLGIVEFGDNSDLTSPEDLNSLGSGQFGYFVGMVNVSYRIKGKRKGRGRK